MDRGDLFIVLAQVVADEHRFVGSAELAHTIDKVAAPLDHALVDELLERLFLAAHAIVMEELIPETAVDQVAGGVLGAAHIEVDMAPVLISFLRDERLVVVGIHIAQVVSTAARKARHGVEVEREDCLLVDLGVLHHLLVDGVPSPLGGAAQRWLAALGRFILRDLRQLDRQALFRHHTRNAVVIVHRERLTPIALAREDGIAQTVVDLHASDALLGDEFLRSGNGFLHSQSVEREAVKALLALTRRVGDDAFLGVEALLRDVGPLDERDDGQTKMLGKGIVAAVVSRYGHDGARTISGEHILRNPDRDGIARQRVDGVRTGEHTRDLAVGHTLQLSALFDIVDIFVHLGFLLLSGHLADIVRLGGEHHKRHAEHGVGTGSEDGELHVGVLDLELHLSTF